MVLKDKETWMNENFGRWVKDNEIIIEDLPYIRKILKKQKEIQK